MKKTLCEYNKVCPSLLYIEEVNDLTPKFRANIIEDLIIDKPFKDAKTFKKWLETMTKYWRSPDGHEHLAQFMLYRYGVNNEIVYLIPEIGGQHDRNNKASNFYNR